MADLPVGATFGSLVHAVLEHTDPDARRPARRAARRTSTSSWSGGRSTLDREELADALVAVCDSPLGPLADDATLREIAAARPAARDGLRAAARRRRPRRRPRRRHASATSRRCCAGTCPRATRCAAYADALDRPALGGQSLRGYLTGSVDVVLRRAPAPAATSSSTTRPTGSARRDEPLTAHGYRPEALAAAMGHSDYPLQALLYAVVLHRFLRWRQPGYDPAHAPRRRALPLPARHVRPGDPAGRRCTRAASSRGGRRSRWSRSSPTCSTDGRGGDAMTELFEPVGEHDWRLATGATGLLARRSTRPGVLDGRRRPRRRPGSATWRARPTSGCCSRSRWRCAPSGTGRSASTSPRSRDARARAALARRRRLAGRGRRRRRCVAAGAVRLRARPALPRPLPPARDPGRATTSPPAPRSRRPRSTRRALARARASGSRAGALQRRAGGRRGRAPCRQWTTVLTGGPGTGKTTTVARLLALLADQAERRAPALDRARPRRPARPRPGSRRRSSPSSTGSPAADREARLSAGSRR